MLIVRALGPALVPVLHRALTPHFDEPAIMLIVDQAFADYEAQTPLATESCLGGRLMRRLAALTIGFYRSLVERGLTEGEARSLTARVTGRFYNAMATVPTLLSRLGAPKPGLRLRRATDLFRRFPFSAPSYDMVDVPGRVGVVAFDVRRCPAAEQFRSEGLARLCVTSWCNLDFSLAERWGARLLRTTTLAEGACRCDFRWLSTPEAVQRPVPDNMPICDFRWRNAPPRSPGTGPELPG